MVALTSPPKRCVSVSSSQANSSNNSVVSSSECSENPFMTLVDAATSLLDRKVVASMAVAARAPESPSNAAKIPLNVEVNLKSIAPPPSPINCKDENKKQTFAELLMLALEDPANEDVMSWMPDGEAFTICNHKKFTMGLMPKLFSIRNMSSFVRKLGRWGFTRVHEKETRNSDIFKHTNFRRGDWQLCKTVKCVGSKSQGKPSPSSPNKHVIDLVAMENEGHLSPPTLITGSPSHFRTAHMMRRMPSSPALVTPTSDKALLRLEHARRLSAHSRPSAFRGKGLGDMTNEVVEAAIETLRRDEETVIVSMPRKYLTSHRGPPPPGVRVLSSGCFPRPPYPVHHHTFGRTSFVRHPQHRPQSAPVLLNTRPTNSGAVKNHRGAMHYGAPPQAYPMKRASYQAPPSHQR